MSQFEKITLTKQQLDAMSTEQLTALILKAHKVQATFVVRRPDGTVKYDRPELAGTYGEEHIPNG